MSDLLAEATAELYDADPEEFTQLRQALVAQARDQGQPAVAKRIGVLRKPTRSAWVVNRLARAHPEAATRLAELAGELRAGGDGARIRELTQARGRLVDELARQAFAAAATPSPSAAVREDVIATLNAALADPEVAADLAAGTLTKAAHWAGFGLMPLSGDGGDGADGGPARTAGREASADAGQRARPSTSTMASTSARPSTSTRSSGAAKAATAGAGAAEADAASALGARQARQTREARQARQARQEQQELQDRDDELERRRIQRERIQDAERALAEATQAAEAANATERELEDEVRQLEADLEDARQQLADARRRAYRAHARQQRVTAELDRMRK